MSDVWLSYPYMIDKKLFKEIHISFGWYYLYNGG